MLTALSISQFAIAEKLELDFSAGMTAITGETGAGKSISLDALSFALGARADSSIVRSGADKADIRAVFDISALPAARQWLQEHDLEADDDDCILRRVITSEGRSKAYINGCPVNLQQLKTLGDQLVDIHSQHAHHQLMRREYHQVLLDAYADCRPLLQKTATAFAEWQQTAREIQQLQNQNSEADKRKEFLQFQLQEFDDLKLEADEYETLEKRHQLLANAESLMQACQQVLDICHDSDQQPLIGQLEHSRQLLQDFEEHFSDIRDASELLSSASIQVDEACRSLRQQLGSIDNDSDSLQDIETRLASIHDLARKHRVAPQELPQLQQELQDELNRLDNSNEHIEALQKKAGQQREVYMGLARQLTQLRETASEKLTRAIKQQLKALGMQNCQFVPLLNTDTESPKAGGFESVEFLISTNPGSPPQGLQKIASGGELSRISLAIQVITATASTIPTLIFDEVDVGIGGATAEVVGRLLNTLSRSAQIICVTHQAQVAACADHHLYVAKQLKKGAVHTFVKALDDNDRVHEIARMLGGVEITRATLDHAAELIGNVQKQQA